MASEEDFSSLAGERRTGRGEFGVLVLPCKREAIN